MFLSTCSPSSLSLAYIYPVCSNWHVPCFRRPPISLRVMKHRSRSSVTDVSCLRYGTTILPGKPQSFGRFIESKVCFWHQHLFFCTTKYVLLTSLSGSYFFDLFLWSTAILPSCTACCTCSWQILPSSTDLVKIAYSQDASLISPLSLNHVLSTDIT